MDVDAIMRKVKQYGSWTGAAAESYCARGAGHIQQAKADALFAEIRADLEAGDPDAGRVVPTSMEEDC